MEVSVEGGAQAVLLEGMEETQYITIHSADGESLGKGISLFTLNGEIISEGMVVDMINSDIGAEYSTTAQYYETEDLLPPDMTEEDKKLAAALVAVQIQQQQKQQLQTQDDPGLQDTVELQDAVELQTLEPVNMYNVDPISESNLNDYPNWPDYKYEEEINFKYEDERESSEELIPPPGPKKLLPHKKRIPRKLKKSNSKKEANKANKEASLESVSDKQIPAFKCELCSHMYINQLKFFEHLKAHYEPLKPESAKQVEARNNLNVVQTPPIEPNVIEEFSENEDLMEGIRGVVEETGARIDDETDNPLLETSDLNWPSAEEIENLTQIARKANMFSQPDEKPHENLDIPQPAPPKKEKKRSQKMREDHTCKICGRFFNHKNSLIYHMRSHSGDRPHQCEVCGKRFFAASALKVHKRLHSGDKPYKCLECTRTFRQWGDLKYHVTSLHSELRQFQCEFCGKDFARKYSLVVHQRIHTGEKNYRCEFCQKTFRASSYLQNHRRIHTGEKPHPCTICGKPFRVRSDMKRHMQTHTRGKPERPTKKPQAIKPKPEEDQKSTTPKPSKTVRDLVEDLKLEVEPESIGRYEPVALVAPEENHESILPHENTGNLEFVQPNNEGQTEGDLEPTIRNSDNFHYLFM